MSISKIKELFSDWRSYLAELLATFLFILISTFVILVERLYGGVGTVGAALVIGLSYAALISVSVNVAGGYLNPAITVSLWLVKRLTGAKTIFFLIAQIIASFAAAAVLLLILGDAAQKFDIGTPSLGLNVNLSQAVILEAIFTAGLVYAIFGSVVDRRGPASIGPLILGLYLVAASIILLPVSGAVLNPARALGPSIMSSSTSILAVWIIGPLIGSLFGIIYEFVFLKKNNR